MKRILLIAAVALLCCLRTYGFRTPAVPEYMIFAGDTVRFDSDYMRERMDREIMTFCYMHTTSTLMLKRSGRYFKMISPILHSCGVPDDLKYLMVIESNLDPLAVSATGASGLWQFTRATAKDYGLEISEDVDERFNIEKETRAACTFLKKYYEQYGDWMLVAAAYNAGPNGITARIEQQRVHSAFDLFLKEETSRYMFRLMAAKMMFENPYDFGFDVQAGDYYRYVAPQDVVSVKTPIADLVDFAEAHGVTYADIRRENPWLRSSKLSNKSGKTYFIRIPRK